MRKTSWVMGQVLVVIEWGLILGLCIPMLALDARAESLNVKPSAWEMTMTTVTSGIIAVQDSRARVAAHVI